MKKIILSLVGISFLFLSCNNELLDFQDEAVQEDALFSASISSNSTADCTPDIAGLESNLPDAVSATTTSKRGPDGYFTLDIEGNREVSIYSQSGQFIKALMVSPSQRIDISEWESGIYIVKLTVWLTLLTGHEEMRTG